MSSLLWLLAGLGVAGLVFGTGRFLWQRYMVPSEDPRVAYRRLTTLGALASVGPAPYQTPLQYRQRLAAAFPRCRDPLSVIIGAYVRSRYGAKVLALEERRHLTQAWLKLRLPMLFHFIPWRNP